MKTNKLITRRDVLLGGLTAASGLLLTGCSKNLPPTYGNIPHQRLSRQQRALRAIREDITHAQDIAVGWRQIF